MGLFITFEGIEGCGKTTQLNMVGGYLASRSIPFTSTAEPGGTPLGRKIREILLNRHSYALCAEAELLLFCAARAQHVRDVIVPALAEGQVVLCDRFSDATLVYQGYGRGLDVELIRHLTDFSAGDLKPDFTLLFDLPEEVGLARAFSRIAQRGDQPAEDRFEREERAFHRRIREGYLRLAQDDPRRYRIVDASRGIDAVYDDVLCLLKKIVEERSHVR